MIVITFIQRAIMQSILLLFGSTGETITEKGGNLNLGIPGIMYVGGISGVIGAFFYEKNAAAINPFLAVLIPLLSSILGSALMGPIGMVIAIALACNPKILLCDEPTTALDVTIQAQILQLLRQVRAKYHLTIVLITHDLGVVANLADRVAVMYAGDIVEIGTADEIYYDPRHPYTWALLSSMPQMGVKGEDLFSIPGTPPNLFAEIRGDAFAPRNPQALKIDFVKRPPYFAVSPTHKARTWLLDPRAPHIEPPAAVKKLQKEGL